MRELLSKQEKRQLRLLELLYFDKAVVKMATLEKELKCSRAMIIRELEEMSADNFLIHTERYQSGMGINFSDYLPIFHAYSYFFNKNETFHWLEKLFADESKNLSDWAALTGSSEPTLYRSLRNINQHLERDYGIRLVNQPLRPEGPERKIRLFQERFYFEKYTPYNLPETAFSRSFTDLLREEAGSRENPFAEYHFLRIHLLVLGERIRLGHCLCPEEEELSALFGRESEFRKNSRASELVRALIKADYLLCEKQNEQALSGGEKEGIRNALLEIARKNRLHLENVEDLTAKILCFLAHSRSGRRPVPLLADELEAAPEFFRYFNQTLYEQIYEYLYPMLQQGSTPEASRQAKDLSSLLLLSWEGLYEQFLKATPIKMLFIPYSLQHFATHAASLLKAELPLCFELTTWMKPYIDLREIEEENADIIISQPNLPDLRHPHLVHISLLPDSQELDLLLDYLNQVYWRKIADPLFGVKEALS